MSREPTGSETTSRVAAPDATRTGPRSGPLIIACGALIREVQDVLAANGIADRIAIRAVPATFHNRPEKIALAVRKLIRAARGRHDPIFVAFADCGTAGELDKVLTEEAVPRLPGAHCYAFYSGLERFAGFEDDDLGSFYLTDFLARHFESLVWKGLGLDRHPELRDLYFAHYRRVVYLSQAADAPALDAARVAAERLDLAFEHRPVGYGAFATELADFATRAGVRGPR